jgi:hypothetical protein
MGSLQRGDHPTGGQRSTEENGTKNNYRCRGQEAKGHKAAGERRYIPAAHLLRSPCPECHALLPLLPVNAMPLRLLAKFRLPPSAVPPLAALRKPSRTAAGTYLFVHFAFLVLCVYKLSVCEWWANPGKSATQKKAEQQAKKAEKNEKAGTASRK